MDKIQDRCALLEPIQENAADGSASSDPHVRSQGFNITRLEADQEFSCIVNDVLPIGLNITDADDHVPEVERSIRTTKERTRCTVQGLPFRRIPKVMMRAAIEGAHKALNQFPTKNGASDILSPLTIMTGKPRPDYNDLKIGFGAYALVYEANDPTNTNKTRSTGAITLTPTGNAQGGYFVMSLTTGRRLSRHQWDELPRPDGVIAAVEAMAEAQEQPVFENGTPVFEWSPGIAIADEHVPPIIIDLMDQGAADRGVAAPIDADEGEDSGAEVDSENEDDNGSEGDDYDNLPSTDENPILPDAEGEPSDKQSKNDEATSDDEENEDDGSTIDEGIAEEEQHLESQFFNMYRISVQ
jgi:hypothetical protein